MALSAAAPMQAECCWQSSEKVEDVTAETVEFGKSSGKAQMSFSASARHVFPHPISQKNKHKNESH